MNRRVRIGGRFFRQMKAKNRKDYTGTRDEIIAMGYQPCKRCNP